MFKNITLFRLGDAWPQSADQLADALGKETFAECGATQQKSTGWVPPRGEAHGALVEAINGQWIARFAVETKTVPSAAVRKHADEAAKQVEETIGRKPGKKALRELRDDAMLALLLHAFPRQTHIFVWLNPATRVLTVGTTVRGKGDDLITSLVRVAGEGFAVALLQTVRSPQAAMAAWLSDPDAVPDDFYVERECELEAGGDEPARVRFDRHNLDIDEVRRHIAEGKLPTRLALNRDGRLAFTLTRALQLKKLDFTVPSADGDPESDRFDADVALATGELNALIPTLVDALGGEHPLTLGTPEDSLV